MAKRGLKIPEFGSFQAIKLGSGVIGKTAPLMGAFIVFGCIVVGTLRNADPFLIVGVFAAILVSLATFVGGAFWYARAYPAEALLEGGELLRYREMDLAANDPKVIDISPEGAKNEPPPVSLRSGETS